MCSTLALVCVKRTTLWPLMTRHTVLYFVLLLHKPWKISYPPILTVNTDYLIGVQTDVELHFLLSPDDKLHDVFFSVPLSYSAVTDVVFSVMGVLA